MQYRTIFSFSATPPYGGVGQYPIPRSATGAVRHAPGLAPPPYGGVTHPPRPEALVGLFIFLKIQPGEGTRPGLRRGTRPLSD